MECLFLLSNLFLTRVIDFVLALMNYIAFSMIIMRRCLVVLSVDDRLQSSRNEKAKAVLTAMKDYVLEFENESSN